MNSEKEIRIYSFYYKDTTIPIADDLYIPVMAGNVIHPNQMHILGDDTGNTISKKNPYYSELTGIYWVWKNTQQDVTGTCHYRRYFLSGREPLLYRIKRKLYWPVNLYRIRYGLIHTSNIELFRKRIIGKGEVAEILKEYDCILPQKRKLHRTVNDHYQRCHNKTDLKILENILADQHPEYLEAFREVLHQKRLYANNMFIMSDHLYQKFMSWWFGILFEFEKRVNLNDYTDYQQRIMGFLGERLLTVWFKKHDELRIKELPLIYFKKLKYNTKR